MDAVHLKIKMHTCQKCGISFSASHNLKVHHRAVHLKVKDFKCDKCDSACFCRMDLMRHDKSVHLKIKEHFCEECGSGYADNGQLRAHVKVVQRRKRPHQCQCDICFKSFPTNNRLNTYKKAVRLRTSNAKSASTMNPQVVSQRPCQEHSLGPTVCML